MADRISLGGRSLTEDGSVIVAIDENEQERLGLLLDICLPDRDKTCVSIVQNPRGVQGQNFSYSSEYAYFMFPRGGRFIGARDVPQSEWDYSNLRNWGGESTREHGKNSFYPIYVKNDIIVRLGEVPLEDFHPPAQFRRLDNGEYEVWPIDKNGVERKWRYSRPSLSEVLRGTRVVQKHDEIQIQIAQLRERYKTVWVDPRYDAGTHGTRLLGDMLADKFSFPKSLFTVLDCLNAVVGEDKEAIVVDFFAGSGTTGHAVINLNREDGGNRKYVLVEMGGYFDSVLKPRIQKAAYSKDWRDGKPVSREGVSHIFKYVRLESYEDTLNNLSLSRTDVQDKTLYDEDNKAFREAYTISYMMDFETKGSPSLLDLDAFEDPFSYTLDVTRGDETRAETVDLVETFGYLLGLAVRRRYAVDGFRVVEGTDPAGEEVLVVWRNTREKSNDDLDAFFESQGFAGRAFDRVYANGDNTLALKTGDAGPKVHLIEEEFRRLMFEAEGV